ncbi:MAG: N-acetylmuramoyl-L-alanine amidase [Myxococcota bacterium]|jgi:N-acetylmuramoyl-L-alanine amidase
MPAVRTSTLRLLLPVVVLLAWARPADAQPFEICIDPGHGGADPGAVGCGIHEADVTLAVSLKLKALIDADPDLTAIMTRSTDATVSLAARASFANDNGSNRFASIHSNAFNGAVSGIETFCYSAGSSTSFDQRDKIQANMLAAWPELPDRKGKVAEFYVIKNTAMPATLSELAFTDMCALDAIFLASPAKQQLAAEAHYNALRKSLGLTGDGPIDPPIDDEEGELRGVVFQDQGVGLADTSIRLPGATVEVLQGGSVLQSMTASGGTADWDFQLDSGAYIVRASLAGFKTAQRSCQVATNTTSWCSIGLFVEDEPVPPIPDQKPPGPDTGNATPDAGPTPDAGSPGPEDTGTPDAGPVDAGTPDPPGPDVNTPSADASPPDTGQPDAGSTVPPGETDSGSLPWGGSPNAVSSVPRADGGCATGGSSQGGLAVILIGLLLVAGRRHTGALLLAAIVAGCASPLPAPPTAFATAALTEEASISALDVRQLAATEHWSRPLWAGERLVVTSPKLDRLAVLPEGRVLVASAGCGYGAQVLGTAVQWRHPGQRRSDVPLFATHLDGTSAAAPHNPTPGHWILVTDTHAIEQVRGGQRTTLSPSGDQFCCATTSRDGRWVAFVGVETGLWLVDAVGNRQIHLGPGSSPAFDPASKHLVFERTRDDGARITASVLRLVSLGTGQIQDISGLPERPRHPALSGARLAFEADGRIYMASLSR